MNETFEIDLKEEEYLWVAQSQLPNSGSGLFTAVTILKDEVISVFKGKNLSREEANAIRLKGEAGYFITLLDGSILDSNHVKCFAKYANDCDGSKDSELKNNAFIGFNEKKQICLIAKTKIEAKSEVFVSYGKKYWQ